MNLRSFFSIPVICYLFFVMVPQIFFAQSITSKTFSFTGSTQTFVIPSCISSISVTIFGGAGANAGWGTASPAMVYAVMNPTPGQLLYINVGGQGNGNNGGWNGGGNGGVGTSSIGGGGGGASDIRLNSNSLSNRIIVMGGGGGSGSSYYNAANGGDANGYPFNCVLFSGKGGDGGTGYTNGQAGACNGGLSGGYGSGGGGGGLSSGGTSAGSGPGGFGQSGSFAIGGYGGGSVPNYGGSGGGAYGAGGGGGGVYGGAGGMCGDYGGGPNFPESGGGGAGSSYIDTTIFSNIVQGGMQLANGGVFLQYSGDHVSVNPPISMCSSAQVTLTAAGVVTYTWLPFTGFAGSNTNTIVHTPTATTIYTVQGTNSNGCISTAITVVNINNSVPTLSVLNTSSATLGVCLNKQVILTAVGANNYTWSPAIQNGVPFIPLSTQTYTLKGQNSCGTSSLAITITVNPSSSTLTASSPTVCSTGTVILTASGGVSYTWSAPSGTITNGVPFTPTSSGVYSFTGTTGYGCSIQSAITLTVIQTPAIAPTASTMQICYGSTSTLIATGASNYTWQPLNVFTPTVSVSPQTTTIYTLTQRNGACYKTNTLSIAVMPVPAVSALTTPSVVCPGFGSTLLGGGALSYTWTAGNSFTAVGASVPVTPISTTIYTLTASDNTCSGTTTVQVTVNPTPTISAIASPTLLCIGQTATVSGLGGVTYTWTSSSGSFVSSSFTISASPSANYSVSGVDSKGCVGASQITITANPIPLVAVVPSSTISCAGTPVLLSASGANNYVWSTNAASAPTSTVIVTPQTSTIYTVNGTSLGCSASTTVLVVVSIPPVTLSGAPPFICLGESITITASGASTYSWSNNATGSSITVAPITTTMYTVYGTNSFGCSNFATQTISVSICTAIMSKENDRDLTIYPNPSSRNISVTTPVHSSLKIVNELGVEFITGLLLEPDKVITLDLPKGLYLAVVTQKDKTFIRKILITE